jgi:uncharacterized protein DUF4209
VIRLQQALELAESSGLSPEIREIKVLMGQISADDLDLKRIEAEVSLPRGEIDGFADELAKLELSQALRVFGAQGGPPTGDPTETEADAVDVLRGHPLSALFPKVILGETYPTVVFKADTPERRERTEIAEYRARMAQLWSVGASSILASLGAAHETGKGELDAAIATPLLTPELRERIARAFELHFLREHDECVHVLVPRLEAAVREIAAAAGVAVVVPSRGDEPGGVATLGSVLGSLRGVLDEGWRVYLKTVLTDPLALNLRNAVAHGTRTSFGPQDAALLLHIACFLIGLTITPPEQAQAAK